jgi:transcriptional regulator with XRE-family HTH domain
MPEHNDDQRPTVRRVLGNTLRRYRERAQLSLRDLAEKTTYNHTYIGRVERGEQLPSDALAHALDEYFDTGGALFELLELAREGAIQPYSRALFKKEDTADRIQVFTSSVVPGLLQTEGYIRALFQASGMRAAFDGLEEAVAARLNRKRVFERKDPPIFWGIMDEAALRRPVGGRECMRQQLEYLLDVSKNPDVTCQVYPFDAGEHPMLEGSLTMLTMPDGEMLAYVESFESGELVESPKRILRLSQRFDVVRSKALSPDESLILIKKYAEEDYG